MGETGKCSHPHLYRWGFSARLNTPEILLLEKSLRI